MPPKKVTMAPGAKGGTKDTKTTSKNGKPVNKTGKTAIDKANPFQRATKDMSRAGDIRKQRDKFQQIIIEEREQKEREIRELHEKIDYYRKDNEKIQRQQKTKFGLTLDKFKYVKEDLHQSRSTNDSLLHELDARKDECDKLQVVMSDVIQKINALVVEHNDLNRERKIYEQEREQVARNEIRIHDMVESNKEMRSVLLRNKINPNTDASQIHVTSPRSNNGTKLPVIITKDNILSFRSRLSEESTASKRKPRKGILRRTNSTGQGNYMSAHEFMRRQSEPWVRRQSVDVLL